MVWGTDSIWFGTPQDQIQALRTFQISDELQERHGYPALTDEIKAKIFGINSARLYGIEPITGPSGLTPEEVEAVRGEPAAGADLRPDHLRRGGRHDRRPPGRLPGLTRPRGQRGDAHGVGAGYGPFGRIVGRWTPRELSRPARRLKSELADDGVVIDADDRLLPLDPRRARARPAAAAVRAPHAAVRVDDRARRPLAHRPRASWSTSSPLDEPAARRWPAASPTAARCSWSSTHDGSRKLAVLPPQRAVRGRHGRDPGRHRRVHRAAHAGARRDPPVHATGHGRVVRLPVDVPPQRPGPARPAAAVPAGHRPAGPRAACSSWPCTGSAPVGWAPRWSCR